MMFSTATTSVHCCCCMVVTCQVIWRASLLVSACCTLSLRQAAQTELDTAMDNGTELAELEATVAEEGVPPAQAESLDQTCSQIIGIWRRHGRADKIAELHELIGLAGGADALLEKVQQKYTQQADALGRADKPIPAGTRIAVAGRGRAAALVSAARSTGSARTTTPSLSTAARA